MNHYPHIITTKFLPCTDHKGARTKISFGGKSRVVGYDHAHNGAVQHAVAELQAAGIEPTGFGHIEHEPGRGIITVGMDDTRKLREFFRL